MVPFAIEDDVSMSKICSKPFIATRKTCPCGRVYGHILSARACSMRDVQAIDIALILKDIAAENEERSVLPINRCCRISSCRHTTMSNAAM